MYVMIMANIAQFCGPVEIIAGCGSGNPTSPPAYWLENLSGHPDNVYKKSINNKK